MIHAHYVKKNWHTHLQLVPKNDCSPCLCANVRIIQQIGSLIPYWILIGVVDRIQQIYA